MVLVSCLLRLGLGFGSSLDFFAFVDLFGSLDIFGFAGVLGFVDVLGFADALGFAGASIVVILSRDIVTQISRSGSDAERISSAYRAELEVPKRVT